MNHQMAFTFEGDVIGYEWNLNTLGYFWLVFLASGLVDLGPESQNFSKY